MSCHAGEKADKTQPPRTRLIGVNGEFIEMDLTRIKQEAGSESDSDIEKVVLGLDSEGEAEEGRDAAGGSCLRQSRCTFPGKIAAPWDHDDITALISVWGQERFQAELSETFRNIQVFERIAAALRRMGVQRSAVQCRGKIKKLKQEHKRCKESLARGGSEHRAFQHYQQLERVLNRRRAPREPAGVQGRGPGAEEEEEEEETTRDSFFMSDPAGGPPLEPQAPPLSILGPPPEPGTPTALEEAPSSSTAEAAAPTPMAPPKSQRRRKRRGAEKTTLKELLEYLRESDEKLLALQAEFMAAEREERQRDREAASHDHALICGALHRLAEAYSGYLPSHKEIELD
ncbi:uncharacterized protein LOC117971144 isoform X3 [Acipenser ruthenus]|uniref:uncharacterized protein LOC117971144 isoform X3 n=1 Tax=Acipenser ruthenus TaxID=7906 RepID=UPI0027427DAB|nr:uncharacterized protein LOC117971144 isoform X3 [Acipenser ruthenus]